MRTPRLKLAPLAIVVTLASQMACVQTAEAMPASPKAAPLRHFAAAGSTAVSSTPPYTGADLYTDDGKGLARAGFVARFPNWTYQGDVLAEFRKKRGLVDPARHEGLLSNPYHESGTGLNFRYGVPKNFTGHLPVYTRGNWWPYIGPQQPQPPHNNLGADAGIYLVNGALVDTVEPLLIKGSSGATVVNKTGYGILLTSGSYPGNEQPGQVMTPLKSGESAPLPIPPKGWYLQRDGVTGRTPELYVSVAGLNPLDAPGWHHSSYSTIYGGGGTDYGTPGFAYLFSSLYVEGVQGSGKYQLHGGLHKNEGYDPLVSGDPGYGVAVYIADELVAVTDLYLTGSGTARQDLWSQSRFTPRVNDQGGLSAYPNAPEGQSQRYELVAHSTAQSLISSKGGATMSQTYASKAGAPVQSVALPDVIAGNT